jgi:hypothetical protein
VPVPTDRPEPGVDYPRDWQEFLGFFPDEAACARWLERLSWPNGFVCPRCGQPGPPWRGSRRRLVCRACGHQASVTAGTQFEGTRTPLRQWFLAGWLLTTADEGVSARRLQRELRLGSYETAWTMLHRYRRAMVRSGRPRLEGVVEVAGQLLPARPFRATAGLAVEVRGDQPGRVRAQRLLDGGSAALASFVAGAVDESAEVRSTAGPLTGRLTHGGYRAEATVAFAQLDRVAGRLAGWLRGTHHGAATAQQLDWYLDEFTFRFNRRSATHRGLLFYRLLEESVVTPPRPYRTLTTSDR